MAESNFSSNIANIKPVRPFLRLGQTVFRMLFASRNDGIVVMRNRSVQLEFEKWLYIQSKVVEKCVCNEEIQLITGGLRSYQLGSSQSLITLGRSKIENLQNV